MKTTECVCAKRTNMNVCPTWRGDHLGLRTSWSSLFLSHTSGLSGLGVVGGDWSNHVV